MIGLNVFVFSLICVAIIMGLIVFAGWVIKSLINIEEMDDKYITGILGFMVLMGLLGSLTHL